MSTGMPLFTWHSGLFLSVEPAFVRVLHVQYACGAGRRPSRIIFYGSQKGRLPACER